MRKLALWSIGGMALIAGVWMTPVSAHVIETALGEFVGPLQVTGASVAVKCPLTVGGSFEAKTNALSGQLVVDPKKAGAIDGTLAVDLRTLQTGIGLRDNHMREGYLEVQKGDGFQAATLSRIQLDGIDPVLPVGKANFRGYLTLHGQEREVTGTADIRRSGSDLKVSASFPVKVSDFAIASPTYLGVGVRNEVTVAVNFHALNKR
jgi:polyisoprenoid-binding protein YceI